MPSCYAEDLKWLIDNLRRTIALATVVWLVTGCGSDPPVATTVTVSPGSATLRSVGESVQLAAAVLDQTGSAMTGVTVAWTTGDAAVATVSGTGLVAAVANGTATVTATAGGVSSKAQVTVEQQVTAVEVTPAADTLASLGDTLRLSAVASDANGHAVAGAEVVWSSDQESVVAVSGTGLAEALSNGTATVTATAGGVSGEARVTVEQQVAAVEVTPAAHTLASLGDTLRLSAEARDANGHAVERVQSFAWTSGDESVATVDGSGLATAVDNGTAAIGAEAEGVSGSATLTVAQVVTEVVVAPPVDTMVSLMDTVRLAAEARDANGNAVERVQSFAWTSGDESVATVDGSGLATAVDNGTAAIGAEAEGVSGSATLTVAQVVTEVIVAPSADTLVSLGDTLRLSAEAFDANGHAVVDAEVGWSSDQESVVAVSGTGLAEALSNGTATVTATAGGVSGEAQVTVEQQVAAVEVTPAADTLASLGDTLRLSAEASDANGHAVADAEVGWSSDQESVVAVSGTGLAEALSNGTATVTATAGGVSGEAQVTVEQQVAALEVTPAADTLVSLGDTLRLSAEALDANGHAVEGAEVGWSSDQESVVAVSGTGLAEALSNGTATVTATAGGVSGEAQVTVEQQVAAVEVTPAADTLASLGDTLRLSAEASDANGHAVTGAEVGWSSDDTTVATVDGTGLVTAVANGTATVTATVEDVGGSAEVTVIVPKSDRAALVALYHATNGDSWSNRYNWLTDEPLGEWYGVLTDDSGRVVDLDLSGNKLSGTIPPELGHLANLELLNLSQNELKGEIPSELGDLSNLEQLYLHNMTYWGDLTGTIPPELGKLSKLERLYLSDNKLRGAIPSELGDLSNLELLDLGKNSLSGKIPPELGKLSNLELLDLDGNNLRGAIPSELGDLSNLERLYLGFNSLTDPIPASFVDIPLDTFWWSRNDGLCAPDTEEFQEWIDSIKDHWGDGYCDQ